MTSNLLLFLAQAAPAAAAAPDAVSPLAGISQFLPIVCMVVIFYFLLIRPQQKKQKEQKELMSSIKTNDKVITTSGIYGIVANVKPDTVIVKVADNVKIEFAKASIATVSKRSADDDPAVAATVIK